jgi:mono/diheme cytochrome c family protein
MQPWTEVELKFLHLLCFPLFLTACQKLPPVEPAVSPAASEGQDFAQASCGGCHAVGRHGTSPRSNAPPFHVIVNQEGVTAETLSFWLRGAHNYPREMDFYLHPPEVEKLVAYMLTLRDPNYRRPPD